MNYWYEQDLLEEIIIYENNDGIEQNLTPFISTLMSLYKEVPIEYRDHIQIEIDGDTEYDECISKYGNGDYNGESVSNIKVYYTKLRE